VDVRAPEGSYVAYFYSLADQLFATINGLRYHVGRAGSFWGGVKRYFGDPVMATSFTIVTVPFLGLYLVRSSGWRPDSLLLAAIEGVLLNLCWAPPMMAWIWDWHLQRGQELSVRWASCCEGGRHADRALRSRSLHAIVRPRCRALPGTGLAAGRHLGGAARADAGAGAAGLT
jgi:hypothetical protein